MVIVALVLIGVFAMRPGSLLADPRTAGRGLIGLGWDWCDLTSTVALATLCFAAFALRVHASPGAGRRPPPTPPSRYRPEGTYRPRRARRARAGLALWGALFLSNGGFNALFNNPAQLHLEQFGGGYGVIGYMLCLGTALLTLLGVAAAPEPRACSCCLVGRAGDLLLAAFALQTRGPLVVTIVAAIVIVVLERQVSGRRLAGAGACRPWCWCSAFGYMRIVREYAQSLSVGDAISAGVRTDPLTVVGGDFSEVENFVALKQLVPESLPRLDGRSIWQVPGAFLPRADLARQAQADRLPAVGGDLRAGHQGRHAVHARRRAVLELRRSPARSSGWRCSARSRA